MARHLAEFLARPLDARADQGMPPWVAEVAACLVAASAVLFTAGQDLVASGCALAFAVVVLLPHALGRRTERQRPTPWLLVLTTNLALLCLVVCAGLAIGLVVPPLVVTLPLLGVAALPVALRVVRAPVRRLRRR